MDPTTERLLLSPATVELTAPSPRRQIPYDHFSTEGDTAWTLPDDHSLESPWSCKRLLSWIETIIITIVLCSSLYILYFESLYSTWKELSLYVYAVLISDLFVMMLAGGFLLIVRLVSGLHATRQVQPCSSIFLRMFQSISCYLILGFGLYFLIQHHAKLYERPILLWYVGMETAITLIYCLITCPTIYGALTFAWHKIHHKISRHPLVQFHHDDQPNLSLVGLQPAGYTKAPDGSRNVANFEEKVQIGESITEGNDGG